MANGEMGGARRGWGGAYKPVASVLKYSQVFFFYSPIIKTFMISRSKKNYFHSFLYENAYLITFVHFACWRGEGGNHFLGPVLNYIELHFTQ